MVDRLRENPCHGAAAGKWSTPSHDDVASDIWPWEWSRDHSWLYGIPAVVFTGGFLAAASTGMASLVQAGYLTSSMLCIASLSGLGSQATARQGNALGILGVGLGILSSLLAVSFPPALLAWFAGVATIGGTIGTIIDCRIMATELPQMVAALHSVVSLAAVLTSIGSVLADPSHLSTLHLVTAYLGVVIGGITSSPNCTATAVIHTETY
ncbi:NAD(P) transhydrogenase beta subunit-domain-containing protein [Suillus subluteus]|nr:NAD(P) transhydrogenase beta subunit-domain-containing protein [Suillus subluteus]